MITIKLSRGTIDTNDNLDGWVITSDTATAEGCVMDGQDMLPLVKGDKIKINGDVIRGSHNIGNIAL